MDTQGKVLGTHRGIIHYTIGQRRGLGIAAEAPLYVCGIDVPNNEVVLGRNEALFSTELDASGCNWISGDVPGAPLRVTARIRYRQPEQPCTVTATGPDTVHVSFETPQRAITRRPGRRVLRRGHGARRRHDRLNRDFWKGGAAMSVTLYLAIPCYNEEAVLPETARRLREKFTALRAAGTIGPMSRICFIDDGSKDATWQLISDLHARDPVFSGIRLSRNRGHQNALLCGLMTLRDRADCVISMDADLQDDIDAIDAMLAAFQNGNDIVYGVRASRKQDSVFKRATAQGYYRLLRALGADVVYNHADYRLMSRRALDALAEYKEVNLFLRGLVPLVGYPSTVVYYERGRRFAGKSKYPLRKMLSFAWEGVSSLTVSPLRLITRIGIVMFLVSIAMLIYFLVRYFTGHTVAGWSSLAVSIWAIGGLQLLAIGVVGEYIGKIYLETKARPRYRIETELDDREAEL